MNEYQERIAAKAAEMVKAEKELAKHRLATRRSELRRMEKATGRQDADLRLLIGESSAAYDRGAYRLAASLLSDETLAYQRSLD